MPSWISSVLQWLKDLVEYAALHIWKLLLSGLASVIEAIPVPSFFSQAGDLLGSVPATVLYWVSFLHADFGIPLVLGAYLLRWLIRRIPFIG